MGLTSTDLPILAHRFGPADGVPRVVILGGVHGDEIEGVWAAQALLERFHTQFPYRLRLVIVPMFNLDGVLARDRRNARGVDLNRNLGTRDWSPVAATERYSPGPAPLSEPENRALAKLLEEENPDFILSLHSWQPMLNINGDCRAEAEEIAKHTGYSVEPSIGYPTPGSLGTYAADERGWPTLTYEIERGLDQASILRIHVPAILEALKVSERRTISAKS